MELPATSTSARRLASALLTPVLHVQRKDWRYHIAQLRPLRPDPPAPSYPSTPSSQTASVPAAAIFTVRASFRAASTRPAFEVDVIYPAAHLPSVPDFLVLSGDGLRHLKLADVKPISDWNFSDEQNLLKVLEFFFAECLRFELERIRALCHGLQFVVFDINCASESYDQTEYVLIEDPHSPASGHVRLYFEHVFPAPDNNAADNIEVSVTILYHIVASSIRRIETTVEFTNESLNGKGGVVIPLFEADSKTLVQFVSELGHNVHQRVFVEKEMAARKSKVCMALVDTFSDQLLEFDTKDFSFASFYFDIPGPKRKDNASAVVLVEFYDHKLPRISLISPLQSRSGNDDDFLPSIHEFSDALSLETYLGDSAECVAAIRPATDQETARAKGSYPWSTFVGS
ncbi:hypothetical protein HDU82_006574 [Entophlyctis luteolus]|nr:hypothetical protein HDU82_006574 [Entophlyctis luteolus]